MLPQRFRRASDALQKRFTGGARAYGAHYGFPISNSPRTSNDQKWGVTLEGVDDVDGTDMTESMPDYDITAPDSFDGCADIDNPVQEHEPDPEARPHIVRTNVHSLSVGCGGTACCCAAYSGTDIFEAHQFGQCAHEASSIPSLGECGGERNVSVII